MNPNLLPLLTRTDDIMHNRSNGWHRESSNGKLHVGVDLGTAYTVLT
ncbi:MAG: hypothetical protein HZC38_14765, partial [Chloroflexi bacterium]|nr:hypothetical protein [Chloroflexota bacterium]